MDELNFEVESGPRKVKKELKMSFEQLRDWKLRIANYQKSVRRGEQNVVQTSLFKTQPSHCDPDLIDPCSLSLHSMAFYRLPSSECSEAALYFVIDSIENIILYIGETSQISRRWRTVHKCKDYLSTYQKGIGVWFNTTSLGEASGYLQDLRITRGYARSASSTATSIS